MERSYGRKSSRHHEEKKCCMSKERQIERVKGKVKAQTVLRGTASEHRGVVLTTREGENLIIQRIGGNPFHDPATEALSGHEVDLQGYRVGNIFRFIDNYGKRSG